jgi:hypothetical protein
MDVSLSLGIEQGESVDPVLEGDLGYQVGKGGEILTVDVPHEFGAEGAGGGEDGLDLPLEEDLALVADLQVPEKPLDEEETAGHRGGDFKTQLSGQQKGPFRSGSRQGYFSRWKRLSIHHEDAKKRKNKILIFEH